MCPKNGNVRLLGIYIIPKIFFIFRATYRIEYMYIYFPLFVFVYYTVIDLLTCFHSIIISLRASCFVLYANVHRHPYYTVLL